MKDWTERAAEAAQEIINDCYLRGVAPVQNSLGEGPEHLHWMCRELLKREMSPTKACRWLGYLQGQLILMGLSSLDAEKARNQRTGTMVPPSAAEAKAAAQTSLVAAALAPPSVTLSITVEEDGKPKTFALEAVNVRYAADGGIIANLPPFADLVMRKKHWTRDVQDKVIEFLRNGSLVTRDLNVVHAILDELKRRKLNATLRQLGDDTYLDLEPFHS